MKIQKLIDPILKVLDPFIELQKILAVKGNNLLIGEHLIDFTDRRFHIISIGKTAAPLLSSLQRFFKENRIETKKMNAIILDHCESLTEEFTFLFQHLTGSHPIPSQKSFQATQELIDYLATINEEDICLFLISGGTSAILELPKETITLLEFEKRSQDLFERGLPIAELNRERIHLSQVKGGGLLNFLKCKNIYNLIVNDTPYEKDDWVGSGPTMSDRAVSIHWDNRAKLKMRLEESIPEVLWLLEPQFNNWEEFYQLVKNQNQKMVGLLGEITLTLPKERGRGGRNTHYSAYLLDQMTKGKVKLRSFLSIATDGEDGSSDSAGAYWNDSDNINSELLESALKTFDSASYFSKQGGLISKFKSPTNLMDIRIYFV